MVYVVVVFQLLMWNIPSIKKKIKRKEVSDRRCTVAFKSSQKAMSHHITVIFIKKKKKNLIKKSFGKCF